MDDYLNEFVIPYDVPDDYSPLGWRCPVCGRGLAPHVSECPCHPPAGKDLTAYSPGSFGFWDNDIDSYYDTVDGITLPEA